MLKANKWKLLFSSLVILLPMAAGLIMWNELPEKIPTLELGFEPTFFRSQFNPAQCGAGNPQRLAFYLV